MNDSVISYDENDSQSLAHYGVLGMKWGVRHNPQRAYEKATKKVGKYQKKINKATKRANDEFAKGLANRSSIFGTERHAQKHFARAEKSSSRALRLSNRGANWIKRMQKEFAKQSVVSIDQSILDIGESYTKRITSAADQMYLRNL